MRAHLERTHGSAWTRLDLLDVRWTNSEPPEGARLGLISGSASPTANGTLLLYADLERALEPPIRLPVTATIRPWVRTPVAARELARGAMLTAADIRIEERPLADLRGGTIAVAAMIGEPRGLRARQTLKAGAILTAGSIEQAPVLASGDRVTMRLVSGSIRLAATGIARRSGRPGEVIPVENMDSRKTVLASVVDGRTVEVHP